MIPGTPADVHTMIRRVVLGLVLIVGVCPAARAQVGPDAAIRRALHWRGHERAVAAVTTGLVAAAIAAPCLRDRSWTCVRREALRVGITVAAAEVAKRLVHRRRPDGRDDGAFFSEHTALACVVTLRTRVWALCPAVGLGRIVADRHWATDTLVGAAVGGAVVSLKF